MKILLVLLACFQALAYAGFENGNGGDVLVCWDANGVETSMFYDIYEAKSIRNFKMDRPKLNTRDEYFEYYMGKLAKFNPIRAKRMKKSYQQFFDEAIFVRDAELIDIPDTQSGHIPRGCQIKQLAIQLGDLFPGDHRYTVDADLWDKLQPYDQAALAIHEMLIRDIYLVQASDKHNNTRKIRYFNEVLLSDAFPTQFDNYVALAKISELSTADTRDGIFEVSLFDLTFPNADYFRVSPIGSYEIKGLKIELYADNFERSHYTHVFYEDGRLAGLGYSDSFNSEGSLKLSYHNSDHSSFDLSVLPELSGQYRHVEFHSNGVISKLAGRFIGQLNYNSNQFIFNGKDNYRVSINEDGEITKVEKVK